MTKKRKVGSVHTIKYILVIRTALKVSGNNDRNRYTAPKWQRYFLVCSRPVIILVTSSSGRIGAFIPSWSRSMVLTQNGFVFSDISGALFYIMLPRFSSSFEPRFLYISLICKEEPIAACTGLPKVSSCRLFSALSY